MLCVRVICNFFFVSYYIIIRIIYYAIYYGSYNSFISLIFSYNCYSLF